MPEELIPLGLGPKHEDWTQALPRKTPKLPRCAHPPKPPPPKPVFPRVTLSPVEPMLLEPGTMWPVAPAEAETWLLGLQVFRVMGFHDTTVYLWKMTPTQALSRLGECWRVLLDIKYEGLQDRGPKCQPAAMGTSPSAPPRLVFRVLRAFLLLAPSLRAQHTRWDNPTCTEGVVSVPRGGRAVMACNSSNAFTHIHILLSAHGETRLIFTEQTPGSFSRQGWQLQVRGGQAQLVIQAAQDAHAGQYRWHLRGLQRYNRVTVLNVSEPQDQEEEPGAALSESSWGVSPLLPGSKERQSVPEARLARMVGIPVAVALSVLVVGVLC
ncbi:Secreted and transmembrane protein 1 [Fukomys damarensis]|uniref:Secreted and transmembrane protein 1 n=1 Tax=Fukomys damarensis TaxID=885580 RepID=A0A091EJQ0_FUKDA|nr:Secreted and transmembrane protein 1 [Fukomys damarensis]